MSLTYKSYHQRWIENHLDIIKCGLVIEHDDLADLRHDIRCFERQVLYCLFSYLFDITVAEYISDYTEDQFLNNIP